MRFGFAADAGTGNNQVFSIQPWLSLLEVSGAQTKFAGTQLTPATVLPIGTWHVARFVFPADGGVIHGALDGVPVTSTTTWPPPNTAGRTLDSLHFGNPINASNVIYLHEANVTQR